METSFIFLIALGLLALFGLQNAIGMAMRHYGQKSARSVSACDRIAQSPHAFIGKIPVAYGGALFYALILGQLLHGFQQEAMVMEWLTAGILIGLLITAYYAYLLFFVDRVWCMGCIRIYIANVGMGLCLAGYYFY